jgi:benzodiazapine receptor
MKWWKLIVSILITNAAGLIGSIFTQTGPGSWYTQIAKPSWNPPNYVFGPVWTTLFILMGISLYFLWEKTHKKALTFFGIQLILNILWSVFFFGLENPLLAFIEIIILWIAILLTIIYAYRAYKPSAYLLIPYILWVSFAAVLNFAIYLLN